MKLFDLFRWTAPAVAEDTGWRRDPTVSVPLASVNYSSASTAEQIEQFLRSGAETASGSHVTPSLAMTTAAVHRCTSLICGAVATMPLHLKRRVSERERQDASDDPLWLVLRRKPNPWQTPSQFRRQLQMQLLHRGRAYARKVFDYKGRVQQLIPLHPDRVMTMQLPNFELVHSYTRQDGSQVEIAQREMFHLVGLSNDGVNGIGVIQCAREAIGLAMATQKHGASLFKNGTHAGAVMTHPKVLSDTGRAQLTKSLEAFNATENSGKTLLLEEGITFEKLGMTSAEAEWLAARGFQDHHIYMFFGVPPHMAGDTSKSTSFGTGIEQQSIGFRTYALEDWLTIWEEAINRDLIPDSDPTMFAWFNRAASVQSDTKARHDAYAIARQWGWMSRNDIRALENMNPIPDGDNYDAAGNANAASKPETGPKEPAQ